MLVTSPRESFVVAQSSDHQVALGLQRLANMMMMHEGEA